MNPDDELALRIGRVARAHVNIDSGLRDVYRTLAMPSLALYLANNNPSTNTLVEDCRLMLRKAVLEDDFREAASKVLAAAKQANEVRNRVIHDMWFADLSVDAPQDPLTWVTFRNARGELGRLVAEPPRDLTFLDDALKTLQRTTLRVIALDWGLKSVLPLFHGSFPEGVDRTAELKRWIATMDDRFTVTAEGGWIVEDGG